MKHTFQQRVEYISEQGVSLKTLGKWLDVDPNTITEIKSVVDQGEPPRLVITSNGNTYIYPFINDLEPVEPDYVDELDDIDASEAIDLPDTESF